VPVETGEKGEGLTLSTTREGRKTSSVMVRVIVVALIVSALMSSVALASGNNGITLGGVLPHATDSTPHYGRHPVVCSADA